MLKYRNMKNLACVKGFRDLNEDFCNKLFFLLESFRKLAESFNCYEIKTPTVEFLSLFQRSVGEGTDIVEKEMFLLNNSEVENKFENLLCLKPEATASIVRSMINNGKFSGRYFTFCNLFRRERPQSGRYREFYTFSIEFFGRRDVLQSLECLDLAISFFNQLNIKYILKVNNIGSSEDRKTYSKSLQNYFASHYENLSEDSKNRFNKGKFLRILDSKEDKEIIEEAPKIENYLNEDSKKNFQKILKFLENKKIDFEVDFNLVRGLDYYNDLVFEFIDIVAMGRQNSICGGGNYDGLFSHLGSQDTAAVGFGIGLDRIINLMDNNLKFRKKILFIEEIEENNGNSSDNIITELRKNFAVEISPNNLKVINKNKKNFDYVVFLSEGIWKFEDLKNNKIGEILPEFIK